MDGNGITGSLGKSRSNLEMRLPKDQFLNPATGQVEYRDPRRQQVHRSVGDQIVEYCQISAFQTAE